MKHLLYHIFVCIFLFFSHFSFAQTIRYVAPTALGNGNGNNWENAMNFQDAINTSTGDTELRLRQGTYTINTTLEINNYSVTNLQIMGGYSGDGTTRDYTLYPTILDGRNHLQIMNILFTDVSIDGLNFINGFVTGDVYEGGAAIRVWSNHFKISNSTFKNNISEGTRGAGAIYLKHGINGNILIDNCLFENNRRNLIEYENGQNGGGAIHNWSENVTIRNSKFIDNYSENEGGAIYTWGKNFVIENSEFENNISEKEGGAIYVNYYDLRISNSIFLKNRSYLTGGAIQNSSSSNYLTKIINSLFVENSANDIGGAVLNSNYTEITNSTFIRNSNTAIAHNFFPSSGSSTYRTNIYNSIFYQNTAKPGGYREDINSISLVIDNSDKDIRRNIVQEYEIGTNNMIGVNPIFVNNTTDFRLQSTSPAVNAGNNALFNQVSPTTANTSRDLANNPRLFGTTIDYGAYELQENVTQTPPQCTTIILPAHNATNVSIGTAISWNNVTNTTGYRLTIGTTSGANDILNNVDVGNVTTYNLPSDLDYNTTYYVSIIPYNAAGDAQSCQEFLFTTELQPVVIPQCTTIILPAHNATNVSIETAISWNNVTGATGYRLTIGTTSGANDILNNVDVGNVTTYNLPSDLDYNTTYYVSIIPYNAAGDAQSCQEFLFTTELQPVVIPQCTTIILPAHNATNVSIETAISWNNVTGATGYRLTIGTTSGGNDILNNVDVGNVTTYNLPSDLDYNTTYYVSIIPYNAAGDAQSCQEFLFTTEQQPVVIPQCTTIILPAHNATNVSIGTAISWNNVTGATGYRLTIGTTSGGNDILNNIDVENITTYDLPSDLDYNTTYYVSIIPYNTAGDAQSCQEFLFTTEQEPIVIPQCTTIILPAHNATNVPIGTAISWNNVTGATGYRLTIGTTSGGNDILNNIDVENITTFDLPFDLDYNTTYYVSIIPYNAAGDAQSCQEFLFTTEQQPVVIPQCTTIVLPAHNATNVSIGTAISWNNVTNATGYRLTIGTTSGGNDILNNVDVGNITTYDLPSDLDYNTTYYVSIIPYNAAGDAQSCQEFSFTTEQQPVVIPQCTTIILPAHNATNVSIETAISWNNVTNATGYRLTIGTTSGGNDILNNVDVGNVTTYDLPSDLDYNTTYYVSIIPYNAAGDAQSCQEFLFTTEQQPVVIPQCTTIILPAHNATNVSIGTAISWNNVTNATGYRLTIGTTSGGNDILNNVDVGNVTTYNLPSDLDYNTTYYVSIIPYNTTGDAQSCQEFSFTTELQPVVIPQCTTIVLPAHNATNVSIGTAISWNNVTNATGYRLTIGTTSGGNDILNNVDVGNITTYDLPSDLDYNTTYYVSIIPYNAAGDAQSCQEFLFTTELQPVVIPQCTTIVLPAHNATNVSIGTAISWNNVTNATGYRLTIGTTSGGNDILNNVDVGNVTTYNLPSDLDYNTTYYVSIIPYNAAGDAQSCQEFLFTTELQPVVIPQCTTIILPAHNATNVSIGTAISWNNVTNATGYRLTIGTTSGGNDILNNVDVGNVTTYNLPSDLDYNTTYYVSIIPYNAAGNAQSCQEFLFTTELQPCIPIEAELIIIGNTVIVKVLNNNPPFEYNLDNTGWVSSNEFNNLHYGLHQVEIKSNEDCITTLTFEILELQNFISPNGDGKNDELDFSFLNLKQNAYLLIVDRFGKTIFKDEGENNFIWNGKQSNGTALPSNTYWYFIEWSEINSDTKNKLQGSILLKNK